MVDVTGLQVTPRTTEEMKPLLVQYKSINDSQVTNLCLLILEGIWQFSTPTLNVSNFNGHVT